MFSPHRRRRRFRTGMTFPGWVFLTAFMLTLAAAINTGFNLLYIVVGVIAAFLLVSCALAVWSVRGLTVTADAPGSAHRSQPFAITLRVHNRKWFMPALMLRIERTGEERKAQAFVPSLPAGGTAIARVSLQLDRRGAHTLPSFTLVSSFPFGLIEAWRQLPASGEVLVYPRVSPMRTTAAEQTAGSRYRARSSGGDGNEYFSIREYLPGDDIRKISWKATARTGQLMVRELSRENSRFVLFLLDTRMQSVDLSPEEDDLFEAAVDLVASLGTTLLQRQYNVAVETPTEVLEGGEGGAQRKRLLEFLARVMPHQLEEHPEFDEYHCTQDTATPAVLLVSPDPGRWGRRSSGGSVRVLDPAEVTHA
ncbi:MAG: DUF58 domain-containing protein [Candidatus Hydrogenedens sp.]|nr:DUF58 domain-containing protein [Candidatus Hydrogenedens sp.]